MSRKEARAKGWNTFKENMYQYANEHPEFSLNDFILQRLFGAYTFLREARTAERRRDFDKARLLYTRAVESLEQAEKLAEYPAAAVYVEKLKAEYYDFVVHRDPNYRLLLKHPLLRIKDEPGILQTELYKQFPNRKREDMTYVLYFAEKEGLIRREEKGRSYQLFFVREKAADEPFLKIQDDEIDIKEKAEQDTAVKKGCLFIFTCLFWGFLFVAAGAYTGLIGAGIVVAAFIVWQIIRRNRLKKQGMTANAGPQEPVPALLDNSSEKEGETEKNS